MRRKAVVVLSTVLAIALPASQAMSAAICGTADDAQGNPAKGVGVTVKSPSGQVEGQGTTDNNGNYRIDGLDMGTLNLFLEPGSSGLQGGSGVLDLNDKSKRVNWQLSGTSSAVASQAGPCADAAAALPICANVAARKVQNVIGSRSRRPPISRMSCTPPIAWITEPAPRNKQALKNACVIR